MSKIKTITVTNLKAVSNLTADFNGCTAIITGGNNKGKTTFLRGLIDRLRGLKPDLIVKQGEKEMQSEIELTTGEKFIWKINEKGTESLVFITTDDLKIPVSKAITEKYFPDTFDIDKFLNESPKQQKKILQELAGLDFTEIEAAYKMAYDERTFANRKAAEEKAKCTPIKNDLPVSVQEYSDLQKELDTIDLHNDRYAKSETAATEINSSITRLQKELKELQERKKNADAWLADPANKPKTNQVELQAEISKRYENNNLIFENNKAKEQANLAKDAETIAQKADEKVKEIEAKKLEMIKSAKLPEGFLFTEDGIEFNNMPVTREQLSSSGIYIAALKLAAIKLGKVQSLHFDASHLDKNSLAEIESWAKENDLQLLIERPDYEGGEITYQLIQDSNGK